MVSSGWTDEGAPRTVSGVSDGLLDALRDLFLDVPLNEVSRRFTRVLAKHLDSQGVWLYIYDAAIDGYYPLARSPDDLPSLRCLDVRAVVEGDADASALAPVRWAQVLSRDSTCHGVLLSRGGSFPPAPEVCQSARHLFVPCISSVFC